MLAQAWSAEEPGDVLALIALDESWEGPRMKRPRRRGPTAR
ncbi:MAG TPA: hypothetical protein VMW75_19485 [Thermoanaerobaculia bacterium]|nr:hypothetical protein [Thermoanaerobaculia bacterium]